ncbi:MAG: helix-turn-helix domain-containing protein [Gloeobacteraceae cyanobacterium ES-bin-144]|nr:helix-turn-helix domain-containing protein [Verrucomicrobiales bacterium]
MKTNKPKTPDDAGRFLLPFKEVARILAISRENLYLKIRQGLFPQPIKQGNRSFFEPDDVQTYLSKLKRKH